MKGVLVIHLIEISSGKVREVQRGEFPRATPQTIWRWTHSIFEEDVGVLTVSGTPGDIFEEALSKIVQSVSSRPDIRDKKEESGWL